MNFTPEDFIHPEDRAAREQLEAIPGLGLVVKTLMRASTEQLIHGTNMAEKIRLGPQQLPKIYGILPPICERLGIGEPEFYLEMSPGPNAYVIGDTRIALTVTSGLLDYLEPDEVQAVVAHECGHIACRHMLYHTMAMLLRWGSSTLGPLGALSEPLRLALNYWSRRSEFSVDRAGAMVMGGPTPVIETMIRLSGGPKALTKDINLDLYLAQADAYDQLRQASGWDKLLQNTAIMNSTHPFPAVRAREIKRWCDGEQFHRLMQAVHAQTGTPSTAGAHCSSCKTIIQPAWRFCMHCGAPLTSVPPTSPA